MVLTTRRFVLRHVVEKNGPTIVEILHNHIGVEWFSQVEIEEDDLKVMLGFTHPESNTPLQNELKLVIRCHHPDDYVIEGLASFNYKFTNHKKTGFLVNLDKRFLGLIASNEETTLEFDIEITGDFLITEQREITRDFSQEDPITSDVVLVAEGEKFHVNRAILSLQSSFFYDLFQEENELELSCIHPKTLQDVLQILYHAPDINEHNVRNLIRWAEKFQLKVVTEQCKQFLLTTETVQEEEREWLARYYDLGDLSAIPFKKRGFSGKSEFTDVVLKVQNEKFHINKAILAISSTYFRTMFFGGFQESGQSEIELKHIGPASFQALLEVIYHSPNIHEKNVKGLLELARMYDVPSATKQCELFLLDDYELDDEEKRRLAEEYGLDNLTTFLKGLYCFNK